MFQTDETKYKEFKATWSGIIEYPWGYLESVIFAFRKNEWVENMGEGICKYLNAWKYFKIYHLPYEPS